MTYTIERFDRLRAAAQRLTDEALEQARKDGGEEEYSDLVVWNDAVQAAQASVDLALAFFEFMGPVAMVQRMVIEEQGMGPEFDWALAEIAMLLGVLFTEIDVSQYIGVAPSEMPEAMGNAGGIVLAGLKAWVEFQQVMQFTGVVGEMLQDLLPEHVEVKYDP